MEQFATRFDDHGHGSAYLDDDSPRRAQGIALPSFAPHCFPLESHSSSVALTRFIMNLDVAITILETLTPIAKAIPVLGAPVEGSLEAAGKILKFAQVSRVSQCVVPVPHGVAQEVRTNKSQTKELAEDATRWLQTLVNSLNDAKSDRAELTRMAPYTDEMFRCVLPTRASIICNILNRVLDTIAKSTERRAKQGALQRALAKSKDAEEVVQLRARLRGVYERFMVRCQ
jgi:hypothetical protein